MPTSQVSACEEFAGLLARRCLAMRIRRLNRTITGIYEKHTRDLGVTIAQVNILAAIVHAGPGRACAADLGRALAIEPSTMSRNLERIEANGWIRRRASGDRRRETLVLTPAGRRLFLRVRPAWEAAQHEAEHTLGQELSSAILKTGPG